MEIQGKIIFASELRSGKNAKGEWKAVDYVIETSERYPKKMCFSVMGERIEKFNLTIGAQVAISFDIDANEHNGRWYNSIRAWDCKPIAEQATPEAQAMPEDIAQALAPLNPEPVTPTPQAGGDLFGKATEDNLPF